jgi:MFS family permease
MSQSAPASGPSVESPPAGETNRWVVLVIVCLAQFMVILDATIVNVALPSIQRDLQFSAADLAWVINGYTLIFGGFLLLGGRAGDLFGRKRLFVAGLAIFSIASLLNGLATTSGLLVAARALQGLGAALIAPTALSIVTTTFEEGADRTKALGVWSAIATGGGAFGLLLGGILTETLSWEWIFFVNVPIGIAGILLALRLIPESHAEEREGGADVTALDVAFLLTAAGQVSGKLGAPDLWRRYLGVILDGLRPGAATTLSPGPPDPTALERALDARASAA